MTAYPMFCELADLDVPKHIEQDQNKLNDLAKEKPDLLKEMQDAWNDWARTHFVLPKKNL